MLSLPPRTISRRAFLALPLGWALAPLLHASGRVEPRKSGYAARAALLYGTLRIELTGTVDESVDREAGRYAVQISGQGAGNSNRVESTGALRNGRWAPTRTRAYFLVYGRESRTDVSYDYDRQTVEYHSRSETFFLRRVRAVDDLVPIPGATHLDDVISATLNYADARWAPLADGSLRTQVVRRRRRPREGSEDVERRYRAEMVPFILKVTPDPETGKSTALFDLTRFSSWARENEPGRIVFGPDRRPEIITSSLMLGTSVTIRLWGQAASPLT